MRSYLKKALTQNKKNLQIVTLTRLNYSNFEIQIKNRSNNNN